MDYQRSDRIAELLVELISDLLRREVRDPRLGRVTITGARVTRDLKLARIFFNVLGGEERDLALAGLHGQDEADLSALSDMPLQIHAVADHFLSKQMSPVAHLGRHAGMPANALDDLFHQRFARTDRGLRRLERLERNQRDFLGR